jgi:hypothetical protein
MMTRMTTTTKPNEDSSPVRWGKALIVELTRTGGPTFSVSTASNLRFNMRRDRGTSTGCRAPRDLDSEPIGEK